MRFTLSSILLAGAGIFFSVVANAAEPTKIPFTLRAWHNWRDTSVPLINHYVELDTAGNAIINQTAGYQGFNSVCHPPLYFLIIHAVHFFFKKKNISTKTLPHIFGTIINQ